MARPLASVSTAAVEVGTAAMALVLAKAPTESTRAAAAAMWAKREDIWFFS